MRNETGNLIFCFLTILFVLSSDRTVAQGITSCNLTAVSPVENNIAMIGFKRANEIRSSLKMPEFTLENKLNLSAGNHANYLSPAPIQMRGHYEDSPQFKCFTARTPADRISYVGYKNKFSGELIAFGGSSNGVTLMDSLMDTVYHRFGLLDDFSKVGISYQLSNQSPKDILVVNSADRLYFYQKGNPNSFIIYPFNHQKNARIDWLDTESPDPLPGSYGKVIGYPITFQVSPDSVIFNGNIKLRSENSSELVQGAILNKDTDRNLSESKYKIAFVPYKALNPGTKYLLTITGKLDGKDFEVNTDFTTKVNTLLRLESSKSKVKSGESFHLNLLGGTGNYNLAISSTWSGTHQALVDLEDSMDSANSWIFTAKQCPRLGGQTCVGTFSVSDSSGTVAKASVEFQ